jgi:hypothetical protein
MSAGRRLLGLAFALGLLALVAADRAALTQGQTPLDSGAEVPKRLAYSNTLPESTGWMVAGRSCLLCHSAMIITQQAKDSTGWEKTLTQMEKWGAVVALEERDTLRNYLVSLYGRRGQKPRAMTPAVSATPGAPDSTRATSTPR